MGCTRQKPFTLHLKDATVGLALIAVLTLTIFQAQPTQAFTSDSIITITSEGTVEGTDKIRVEGNVYTLIGDIRGSPSNAVCFILIEKDGVTLDGAGHSVVGTGTGLGIKLEGREGVVIKNLFIDNVAVGIDINAEFKPDHLIVNSTNNKILNNRITSQFNGIAIKSAYKNSIIGNTITSPSRSVCIEIGRCYDNTIADNNLLGSGIRLFDYKQNTFYGNTVNGKPLVILNGTSNQVIDGAGQVLLYDCEGMTIRNVNPSGDLKAAVALYGTSNSRIEDCKGGIVLENSDFNTVTKNDLTSAIKLSWSQGNNITQNIIQSKQDYAINLEFCSGNNIQANTISTIGKVGIKFDSSSDNYIHGNIIYGCESAIQLTYVRTTSTKPPDRLGTSMYNDVFANNLTGSTIGVYLDGANNNRIFANNIVGCSGVAVKIFLANGNAFYHNNFINNGRNLNETHTYFERLVGRFVTCYSANNTWDDGYPSGGNYWSDHTGMDINGDGIGDTAYVAFESHIDNYPLITPFTIQDSNTALQPYTEPTTEPASDEQTTQQNHEPLLATTIIAASATAIVCMGLLVFFKTKRRAPKP